MHMHNHNNIEITSDDELEALVKYMLSHNISHTHELEELACHVKNSPEQYDNIMKALEFYNKGNDFLALALGKMGE